MWLVVVNNFRKSPKIFYVIFYVLNPDIGTKAARFKKKKVVYTYGRCGLVVSMHARLEYERTGAAG